jgi:hypothetical protein
MSVTSPSRYALFLPGAVALFSPVSVDLPTGDYALFSDIEGIGGVYIAVAGDYDGELVSLSEVYRGEGRLVLRQVDRRLADVAVASPAYFLEELSPETVR